MTQETLHRTIGRPLDTPHSTFDLVKALADLRAEPALEREGRNSIILHKEEDLKVVLLVMRKGNSVRAHKAAVPITVQMLEGALRFTVQETPEDLRRGQVLTLHAGIEHAMEALEDCAMLLTLAGRHGT